MIGKSAQFPLHTWLPDAMAGPTPVSALIHAATMVVAGVYLVARLYGVFWAGFSIGPAASTRSALIGGITVIIAALLAFVQNDIKKVLAYSTVSQLGYMVMALGVGAWTAGIFHLFTHAFFKALLFLGAGSVSHAVHSFDMKKDMGGLRKYMPTTYGTFIIGSIALAGIPRWPASGRRTRSCSAPAKNGYPLFLVIGLVGAFMTAAYMTRCVYLTFYGEYRGHGHPHESPPGRSRSPSIVLAVMSSVAGCLNAVRPDVLEVDCQRASFETINSAGHRAPVQHRPGALISTVADRRRSASASAGLPTTGATSGPTGITERNPLARAGYRFLVNKYYLDDLYTGGVVGGIKGPIARAAYWVNQNVIDGVVNGIGIVTRAVARFTYEVIDQKGVDGLVNGAGFSAEEGGGSCAPSRPGGYSSTPPSCSARRSSSPSSSHQRHSRSTMNDLRPLGPDHLGLCAVFLPLVGALVMMLIPKAEGET